MPPYPVQKLKDRFDETLPYNGPTFLDKSAIRRERCTAYSKYCLLAPAHAINRQTHDRYYYGGPQYIGPNFVSKNSEIYTWYIFVRTVGPIYYVCPPVTRRPTLVARSAITPPLRALIIYKINGISAGILILTANGNAFPVGTLIYSPINAAP